MLRRIGNLSVIFTIATVGALSLLSPQRLAAQATGCCVNTTTGACTTVASAACTGGQVFCGTGSSCASASGPCNNATVTDPACAAVNTATPTRTPTTTPTTTPTRTPTTTPTNTPVDGPPQEVGPIGAPSISGPFTALLAIALAVLAITGIRRRRSQV